MLDPQQSLASLALEHPETEAVLRRFQLDLCGRGRQALSTACEARGVAPAEVIAALDEAIAGGSDPMLLDARELTPRELAEHLGQSHGAFQRRALPSLRKLASQVARVHGTPGLRLLAEGVEQLSGLLATNLAHQKAEVLEALQGGRSPGAATIERLLGEQRELVVLLDAVRAAATGFSPPAEACQSWGALYRDLELFEADVLRRLHLEANVLYPKLRS